MSCYNQQSTRAPVEVVRLNRALSFFIGHAVERLVKRAHLPLGLLGSRVSRQIGLLFKEFESRLKTFVLDLATLPAVGNDTNRARSVDCP